MSAARRWSAVSPALIATTCSQKHVQSVIEDAQGAIGDLLTSCRELLAQREAEIRNEYEGCDDFESRMAALQVHRDLIAKFDGDGS